MEETIPKILIVETADYSRPALDIYAAKAEVIQYPLLNVSLQEAIAQVHTIVVRLQYAWNEPLLKHARQLRYIVSPTTGLDHIDVDYCAAHLIEIISLQGDAGFLAAIPSTAELTWGLLLSLTRHIPAANAHVLQGHWDRNLFKGNNLAGMTLGIIGLGRVGKQVAGFAKAFGMQVCAYDPFTGSWMSDVKKCDELRELLASSDVISVHIPATGNDHFLSAAVLSATKRGALFINTSRGSVWDETAVAVLLKNGQIRGVATDVLQHELDEKERPKSPLLQAQKDGYHCIITPHIAGATFESMHATEVFVAEKWLAKQP